MKNPRSQSVGIDIADVAMLATVVIWAANNAIVKAALGRIDPLAYVAGRFAIVVVLLFGWLWIRHQPLKIAREDWGTFLFCGITGYALYNVLFTVGLAHTSAFSVAVLVALGPVFALLFAAALGIEKVRPVQWIGVVVSLVGVAVFVGDKLAGSSPAYGDILALIAAASFAAYSLATRPIVKRYGSPMVTAWSAAIGLVLALPFTLPAVIDQDWRDLGGWGWAALLYSSAISMLVAYTIWGWAIERRGVARTVPYLYLVPVLTGALSVLFLDEKLTALKCLGAALVLSGVALTRRTRPVLTVEPIREAVDSSRDANRI